MAFAPHSGWAAVVVLGGAASLPQVLARVRVEMADPADPESRQPYHAVEDLPVAEAARRLARWLAVAERMAYSFLHTLVADLAKRGHRVASVGVLDSSGRKGGSLEAILASHALIHTADGDHFRLALAAAAERCGLPVSRLPVRDLEAETRLRLQVLELGRQVGPPWGADQKMAALFAWRLLGAPPQGGRSISRRPRP